MCERTVTVRAPINIAVIKYWGKRDQELNLPLSPSLSCTLDSQYFGTTTTVSMSPAYARDRFWLNERERPPSERLVRCIAAAKHFLKVAKCEGRIKTDLNEEHYHLRIVTKNDVPTAAGLASSASGYAALAYALIKLYRLDSVYTMEQLSVIARLGSGSACRSLFGGVVEWQLGTLPDGLDSTSRQVCSPAEWPELQALILVLSDAKEEKWVSSTAGMQRTSSTSTLLAFRLASVLPDRMQDMKAAVRAKCFPAFARLTMQDSNQFHALCLDSYPPILYLNDTSKALIHFVSTINDCCSEMEMAAYTFDAGPHAVVYLEQARVKQFLVLLARYFSFGPDNVDSSDATLKDYGTLVLDPEWLANIEARTKLVPVQQLPQSATERGSTANGACLQQSPRAIFRIVHCTLGPGPQLLKASPFAASLFAQADD